MKKMLFIVVGIIAVFTAKVFAQSTVTLTTYYPAPFGMYNRLGVGPEAPDANTRMRIQGQGNANTTTALRVENSGGNVSFVVRDDRRVGIGTADPNERLEVEGNIHVSGGNRTIFNRSANSLAFGTNNTERMRILAGGNVGIGTATPGNYRLVVQQAASSTERGVRLLNLGGDASVQMWVGADDAVIDAEGSTNLHLRANGLDRIRIVNDPNVAANRRIAIGRNIAATPTFDLSLGRGDQTIGIEAPAVTNHRGGDLSISAGAHAGSGVRGGDLILRSGLSAPGNLESNVSFFTSYNNVISEKMRITGQGRVGIGTKNPNQSLDVLGNIRLGTQTNRVVLSYTQNVAATLTIPSIGSAATIAVINRNQTFTQTQTIENLRATNNVGIGTTSPRAKLDVDGAIGIGNENLECNTNNAGIIKFTSSESYVCGSSNFTTSTLRICARGKTNVWSWYQIYGAWNEECVHELYAE